MRIALARVLHFCDSNQIIEFEFERNQIKARKLVTRSKTQTHSMMSYSKMLFIVSDPSRIDKPFDSSTECFFKTFSVAQKSSVFSSENIKSFRIKFALHIPPR